MMATVGGHSGGFTHGKLTKPRVKPILKKFGSHSEKNSLDLDRSWEEQQPQDSNHFSHIRNNGWAGTGGSCRAGAGAVSAGGGGGGIVGAGAGGAGKIGGARTPRDVTFLLGSDGSSSTGGARTYVQHARSTSGTSHHSHMSVATTGSGSRGGTFVHPFQQMPRTSTPPLLSYANSLASFDNGQRDYSPTITENDDDVAVDGLPSNYPYPSSTAALHSRSQSNLRRPSLVSRTSSLSDMTAAHSTRVNTTITTTTTTTSTTAKSRLGHGLASSRSDLNLNFSLETTSASTGTKSLPSNTLLDSPSTVVSPESASTAAIASPSLVAAGSSATGVTSPATGSSHSAMSPLRSSLEMASFPRIRTYSEVSSAAHMDLVRYERRKFEEKEYRKQERWDQKMVRKRDRDLNREAAKKEAQEAARARENSFGGGEHTRKLSQSAGSKSSTSLPGGISQLKKGRKRKGISPANSDSEPSPPDNESVLSGDMEKGASFPTFEKNYSGTAKAPTVPTVEEDAPHFIPPPRRRTNMARAKTHGAWTSFILWLRTKLFRLRKNS
ncbi:hypothetical protein MKZ38_010437 [Zalerion maritima]|uniref:Uncharacterized protein n=1 Tax=Zalerion maritima TaxID=339359 RepID=A0AAD5WV44_9PEZI|nr:hypothetical protein MKZ38_010437 [Zalerion maritima]